MSNDTDQQLVNRVLAGNSAAFNLLVLRYQSRIAVLVGRFIFDKAEIEDVCQESFIKAYRAIETFRGDSSFYTWLHRIAVNTAKNYLIARSRRPPQNDVELDSAETIISLLDCEGPAETYSTAELKMVIDSAIAGLPEDLRTTYTLREFHGMAYEDIMKVMTCPVGTVRSRIFRARELIDKKVKDFFI